jgi:hypothetical protein
VWTAAQPAQFLHYAPGHRLCALFHLAALLGLRRREVGGLTLGRHRPGAGTLTVARQLQQLGGRMTVAPPKSDAGRQGVALDKTTIAALAREPAAAAPSVPPPGPGGPDRVRFHHNDSAAARAFRTGPASQPRLRAAAGVEPVRYPPSILERTIQRRLLSTQSSSFW